MADIQKEVIIVVKTDTTDAGAGVKKLKDDLEGINNTPLDKPFKNFKQQIKEATVEAMKLEEQFGKNSVEFTKAAKKVAELRDNYQDFGKSVAAFNPDNKLQSLTRVAQGAIGAVQGITGAMQFLGVESDSSAQAIAKLQGLMAFSDALNNVDDIKEGFKDMKLVAIDAFKGIKGAIGATGIGLLVVALGTIYMYWDDIKAAVNGVSQEQKKLNDIAADNVKLNQEKLKHISDQDNILKLQGKSEKEILKYKIDQANVTLTSLRAQIQTELVSANMAIKASERNKELLKGVLEFITYPLNKLLQTVDLVGRAFGKDFGLSKGFIDSLSTMVFNPTKVKEEGQATVDETVKIFDTLKNELAGYQLAVKAIEDKKTETKKGEKGKSKEEILAAEREVIKKDFQVRLKLEQEQADIQYNNRLADDIRTDQEKADMLAMEQQRQSDFEDERLRIAKGIREGEALIRQERIDNLNFYVAAASNAASLLSGIAKDGTDLAKGAAIAGIVIDSAKSVAQQFGATKTAVMKDIAATAPIPNPKTFIDGAIGALGIAQTIIQAKKSIQNIQGANNNGGATTPTTASSPAINPGTVAPVIQGSSTQTQAIQDVRVTNQNQVPVRAYITNRDLQTNEQRTQFLNNISSF